MTKPFNHQLYHNDCHDFLLINLFWFPRFEAKSLKTQNILFFSSPIEKEKRPGRALIHISSKYVRVSRQNLSHNKKISAHLWRIFFQTQRQVMPKSEVWFFEWLTFNDYSRLNRWLEVKLQENRLIVPLCFNQ